MAAREISRYYMDPLDAVWLAVAARVGLQVRRSSEVYASTDGKGTLLIADAASFDPDDCVAQMILHEMCHALIAGPQRRQLPDWGLENIDPVNDDDEHACLRLQAALLEEYGLRQVLAPTTDHRTYYDALPADVIGGDDVAATRARAVLRGDDPWLGPVRDGLVATRAIFDAARNANGQDPARSGTPLWRS